MTQRKREKVYVCVSERQSERMRTEIGRRSEGDKEWIRDEQRGRRKSEKLLPPYGKMKVLDRPVAIEPARTGYIFRDKSETTTSLPPASASTGQDESAR
ncbi:hypothetical protein PoB_002905500 [Plakobranchus ocellatus]|uniref:Uncharacterized protein n=1 Tax=Plakobranchus ocellatus TaxID=259542 RepID=A0AAV4A6V4_9GAST|nr:hypothetical protein PoB_002905500 [Plakobranchus ocellatus]